MKNILGIDKTPSAFEQFFKAAIKLKHESLTYIEMETVPLMELSFLAEDIHVKTQEAMQNTDLDMQ